MVPTTQYAQCKFPDALPPTCISSNPEFSCADDPNSCSPGLECVNGLCKEPCASIFCNAEIEVCVAGKCVPKVFTENPPCQTSLGCQVFGTHSCFSNDALFECISTFAPDGSRCNEYEFSEFCTDTGRLCEYDVGIADYTCIDSCTDDTLCERKVEGEVVGCFDSTNQRICSDTNGNGCLELVENVPETDCPASFTCIDYLEYIPATDSTKLTYVCKDPGSQCDPREHDGTYKCDLSETRVLDCRDSGGGFFY